MATRLFPSAVQREATQAPPEAPWSGPPELTVLICTYNRRDVLLECLQSFSRQQLAPGTFQIILVDDSSTDGTGEALASLQLPVPMKYLRRPRGGLASARNAGLALAEGRLVLLVNDDTIAQVDLVAEHIKAHRQLHPRPVSVLGTFEQPAEELSNALTRVLESSDLVFPYSDLQDGSLRDWTRFWTANVSVPRAWVQEVGGMNESFQSYGCEDTDLAFRLHHEGVPVYFHAGARAVHRHVLDFAALRRRQHLVARAYVRLFALHRTALQHSCWSWAAPLTREYCLATVKEKPLANLEQAAEKLSRIDLEQLARQSPQGPELVTKVTGKLREALGACNHLWWLQGFADGMEELGHQRIGEPIRTAQEPSQNGLVANTVNSGMKPRSSISSAALIA